MLALLVAGPFSSRDPQKWSKRATSYFASGRWGELVRDVTPSMLNASRVVEENGTARFASLFQRLSADNGVQSCCIRVLVLGGSITCGGVDPQDFRARAANLSIVIEPAGGIEGAYSTHLQRGLQHMVQGSCCPEGHSVENLCQGGVESNYFVQTFATRTGAAHARRPADVVILDTAANDFNSYWFYRLASSLARTHQSSMHAEATSHFEALVRLLLRLRPRVGVLALQTAWFERSVKAKGLPKRERYGAWADQEPVLRHYSIPTIHVAHAFNHSTERRAPLYADHLHLSAGGHWVTTYLVVQALGAMWKRHTLSRLSIQAPLAGDGDDLPNLLAASSASLPPVEAALTTIDFTSLSASFRAHMHNASGWRWLCASKRANGSYAYAEIDALQLKQSRGGKVMFMAAGDARDSFVADVRFRRGMLSVGHLRSYEGQADAEVELLDDDARPLALPSRWILNGTWARHVSTYHATRFHVPHTLLETWQVRRGSSKAGTWPARVRVSVLPRRLRPGERSSGEGNHGWGTVSLFVLTTY